MTIDEAIAMMHEWADYECYNEEQIQASEAFNQLAEWLEELKALKENSISKEAFEKMKSIAYKKGHRQGYNKALDDFVEKLIRYVDCGHLCSPTEVIWSDLSVVEMVKKLVEQLKAGVKNELQQSE